MSKRAEACAALMRQGAYWRSQLESGWRGREQFETRLRAAGGGVIPGFGFQTWAEMEDAGLLAHKDCTSSSVWPQEWKLREEVAA